MFFLLSTTPDDSRVKNRKGGGRFILYALLATWILLISFGLVSMFNPLWLRELSDPGRKTEALQMREKGDIALTSGNPALAVGNYVRALEIKPDMVSARVNLGIAMVQMGDFARAESTFLRGLESNPEKDYVIEYNLGSMYSDWGDTTSALRMFYSAAETSPYPYFIYREIGAIYFNQQDWHSAIYYFQKAFENRLTMQNAYAGMLREEVHSWPDEPEIREDIREEIDRGISPDRMAAYDSTVFNQILENDREISMLQNYLGYSHAMMGNLNVAIAHFRYALNIWTDNLNAKRNLNMALQTRQNLKVDYKN